jgi:hypothetical protein
VQNASKIRYEVVDRLIEHYKDNPGVTRDVYTHFRWPVWPSGVFLLPGWKFAHTEPTAPSSIGFYEQSFNIATQRANIGTNPDTWDNADFAAAAVGTLCAYSNSTPYSHERDPLVPNQPSESFRAMRLREYGDCEDVTYEVCSAKREIGALPASEMSPGLTAVKNYLDNYTEFMTLVSATTTDADSIGTNSPSSARQAHMLALFIPNSTLADHGINVEGSRLGGLPVLIGEGTGRVSPVQTPDFFPRSMTARGKRWQDDMITVELTKGVKRLIHSPAVARNGNIVADFYDDIINAYSSKTGLIDFRHANNDLGYSMARLISGNTSDLKLVRVPGTHPSDEGPQDKQLIATVSGFSEPIMPLDHRPENTQTPVSAAVLFARKTFPEARPSSRRDATLVLPFQEVDTDKEMSFIGFLKRNEMQIAEVGIVPQPISNVGAYQFNVTLK